MKRSILYSVAGLLLTLAACTPRLGYFQDVEGGTQFNRSTPTVVKAEPGDKMSIVVGSRNPQLASMFNLQLVSAGAVSSSEANVNNSKMQAYTVAQDGTIQFPVLGPIVVKGLSREEIQKKIAEELISKDLLKDPLVTVNMLDLTFMVMGEVKSPGRYGYDHDFLTLLDAIGRAGDLTIYGKRENVLVTRVVDGKQMNYRVDLTNSSELYSSPAFYLKQNDIIYVEPNDRRAREATSTGNAFSSPSLWISAASLLTTIGVLIFK